MTKQFKQALEALAKAGDVVVEYGCTYCREDCHNPEGHELHEIATFISPLPDDEEEE